jgi:predicted nucleic acid-binding Zn ribbon protein
MSPWHSVLSILTHCHNFSMKYSHFISMAFSAINFDISTNSLTVQKISKLAPDQSPMLHMQQFTGISFFTSFPSQCFPLYLHMLHLRHALRCALDSVAGIPWAEYPIFLQGLLVIVLWFWIPHHSPVLPLSLNTYIISAFDWTFCDAECGQCLVKDRKNEKTFHFFTDFVCVIWLHLVWFVNLNLIFIVDHQWIWLFLLLNQGLQP